MHRDGHGGNGYPPTITAPVQEVEGTDYLPARPTQPQSDIFVKIRQKWRKQWLRRKPKLRRLQRLF